MKSETEPKYQQKISILIQKKTIRSLQAIAELFVQCIN